MDAFSRVVDLAQLHGSLDLRCQLDGSFALDHEPAPIGEAPFHLVLAGRAAVQLPGGHTASLGAGDFLMLPRGSAHRMRSAGRKPPAGLMRMQMDGMLPVRRNTDGDAELDLLCGRFTYATGPSDLIMSALPDVLHLSLPPTIGRDGLHGIVALLRSEVHHAQPGALAVVTALSQALFVLVLRAHAQREGIPASLLVLLGDRRLSRAVLAMLQHPEQPWTVATLAEQAMMSRATFARHFALRGGTSPLELLTLLRMQLARDLLAQGKMSTSDVAERVGYASDSAFGKVFAQRMGVTPAAFRRHFTSARLLAHPRRTAH